ncbi:hypothetical protein [Aureibacter tunicatorum]|uniref:Fibronectin type-III domain-containing protein n=1 Tax=Aureibacter tunicatorum TaxID=866807 RepID=A0AAE4BS22_9BACT|nr:hypothetical protein [Aureibacter tunicatorum]MDR6240774.1 hypothetical protein [Aureibacter tunicatorum]BDD06893.1 hypothetical protein AUTU_43760 [Aureibacter tunicatorum]
MKRKLWSVLALMLLVLWGCKDDDSQPDALSGEIITFNDVNYQSFQVFYRLVGSANWALQVTTDKEKFDDPDYTQTYGLESSSNSYVVDSLKPNTDYYTRLRGVGNGSFTGQTYISEVKEVMTLGLSFNQENFQRYSLVYDGDLLYSFDGEEYWNYFDYDPDSLYIPFGRDFLLKAKDGEDFSEVVEVDDFSQLTGLSDQEQYRLDTDDLLQATVSFSQNLISFNVIDNQGTNIEMSYNNPSVISMDDFNTEEHWVKKIILNGSFITLDNKRFQLKDMPDGGVYLVNYGNKMSLQGNLLYEEEGNAENTVNFDRLIFTVEKVK